MAAFEPSSPFWQAIGYWQTLIAGVLAVVAAVGTIFATILSANREIEAAQQQTRAARDQIETTLRLERLRQAQENYAFLIALIAATQSTLEDAAIIRNLLPSSYHQQTHTRDFYQLRQRMKDSPYDELRAASLRLGGTLTGPLLRLDKAISLFRDDWIEGAMPAGTPLRLGSSAHVPESLVEIEELAHKLADQAREQTAQWEPIVREFNPRRD